MRTVGPSLFQVWDHTVLTGVEDYDCASFLKLFFNSSFEGNKILLSKDILLLTIESK